MIIHDHAQYLMLQVVKNTENINRMDKASQMKLYSFCKQKYIQDANR